MPTVTTIAKYVNPPKPGKFLGSIKGEDGEYYGFKPEKFHPEQGRLYEITYSLDRTGRYKNVIDLLEAGVKTSSPGEWHKAGVAPSTAIDKDCAMFVMGIIGRCFHGTGAFPSEPELASYVKACISAWKKGTAPEPVEDEIPY